MKKPRPAKSSPTSISRTTKDGAIYAPEVAGDELEQQNIIVPPGHPRVMVPLESPKARHRQGVAETYLYYLSAAEHLYRLAADMTDKEIDVLDNQLCEAGLAGEGAAEVKDPDYVPNPSLPRETLEDIIRATRYLIDQGERFKRYHEGGCRQCGNKLRRGKRAFCTRTCLNNWHSERHRERQLGERLASKYRTSILGDLSPSGLLDPSFQQKERNQFRTLPPEPPKKSSKPGSTSLAVRKTRSSHKP